MFSERCAAAARQHLTPFEVYTRFESYGGITDKHVLWSFSFICMQGSRLNTNELTKKCKKAIKERENKNKNSEHPSWHA
jgi:hypothetical protein